MTSSFYLNDIPLKKLVLDGTGDLLDMPLCQSFAHLLRLCPPHLFLLYISWKDFSTMIDNFDFQANINRIEKLTWIVATNISRLKKHSGQTWNFFPNLKKIDIYGHNQSIHELLSQGRENGSIDEVRIEVFGKIGTFVPKRFYEDLPLLLSHLFPLAQFNIVRGVKYGEIGSNAGILADNLYGGHLLLDRNCWCFPR